MINGRRLYAQAEEGKVESRLKVLSTYLKSKRLGYGLGLAALAAATLFLSGCGADYKALYQDERKDNASLQSQIKDKDTEISGYKSQIKDKDIEISGYKSQISGLSSTVATQKAAIESKDSEINALLQGRIFFAGGYAPPGYTVPPPGQRWVLGPSGWYLVPITPYPYTTYVTRPGESPPPGYVYVGPGSYPGSSIWRYP